MNLHDILANPPPGFAIHLNPADARSVVVSVQGTASWLALAEPRAMEPKPGEPPSAKKYSVKLFIAATPASVEYLRRVAAFAVMVKQPTASFEAVVEFIKQLETINKVFYAPSEKVAKRELTSAEVKYPPAGGPNMIQIGATLKAETKRGSARFPTLVSAEGKAVGHLTGPTGAIVGMDARTVESMFYPGGIYKLFFGAWFMDDQRHQGVWANLEAMQFAGTGERIQLGAPRFDASMVSAIPGVTSPTLPSTQPDALSFGFAPGTVTVGGDASGVFGGSSAPLGATPAANTGIMFAQPPAAPQVAPPPMPMPTPTLETTMPTPPWR